MGGEEVGMKGRVEVCKDGGRHGERMEVEEERM